MRVLGVVGSLRAGSLNAALMDNLERLARAADPGVDFTRADLGAIPLFSQDLEAEPPAAVTAFKQQIAQADAVFVMTPEYNRALPGVLKNALDWSSRPMGDNPWSGKPAAIGGASPGSLGAALAQADLRKVLSFLGAQVMAQPELYLAGAHRSFDEEGRALAEVEGHLESYLSAALDFFRRA